MKLANVQRGRKRPEGDPSLVGISDRVTGNHGGEKGKHSTSMSQDTDQFKKQVKQFAI